MAIAALVAAKIALKPSLPLASMFHRFTLQKPLKAALSWIRLRSLLAGKVAGDGGLGCDRY